jgi:hypothetical protein
MTIVFPWHRLTDKEIERVRKGIGVSDQVMRHYLSGRRRPRIKRAEDIERLSRGRMTFKEIVRGK